MSEQELTIPDQMMGIEAVGYTVNAPLSPRGAELVQGIQRDLVERFGDAIIPMPLQTLHITLLDWLAPLVDYGKDKDALFEEHGAEYDQALLGALQQIPPQPIHVHFKEVRASAGAVFIVGEDGGEFAALRQHVLQNVSLLPNTKQPPKIIHSTIARFRSPVTLRSVEDFANSSNIDFVETVGAFRLTREHVIPMQAFTALKMYHIENS